MTGCPRTLKRWPSCRWPSASSGLSFQRLAIGEFRRRVVAGLLSRVAELNPDMMQRRVDRQDFFVAGTRAFPVAGVAVTVGKRDEAADRRLAFRSRLPERLAAAPAALWPLSGGRKSDDPAPSGPPILPTRVAVWRSHQRAREWDEKVNGNLGHRDGEYHRDDRPASRRSAPCLRNFRIRSNREGRACPNPGPGPCSSSCRLCRAFPTSFSRRCCEATR